MKRKLSMTLAIILVATSFAGCDEEIQPINPIETSNISEEIQDNVLEQFSDFIEETQEELSEDTTDVDEVEDEDEDEEIGEPATQTSEPDLTESVQPAIVASEPNLTETAPSIVEITEPSSTTTQTEIVENDVMPTVNIRILDNTNSPISNLKIEIYDKNNEFIHFSNNDSQGEFIIDYLPKGEYNFKAILQDIDGTISENFNAIFSDKESNIEFKMSYADTKSKFESSSNRLDIYVVDSNNNPIADAIVNINLKGSATPSLTSELGTISYSSITDLNGRVTMINPLKDQYTINIYKEDVFINDLIEISNDISEKTIILK